MRVLIEDDKCGIMSVRNYVLLILAVLAQHLCDALRAHKAEEFICDRLYDSMTFDEYGELSRD